jgi:glycosyltransferase involved in cell wall biosynthesis
MGTTPSVSIVIAAYNASAWIGETLDSIARQTFSDYEVIVVDDGSKDNTRAIAKAHSVVTACIEKQHSGQPSSRNAGIRAAKGDFIAFVDADDLWLPKKLELQMDVFEADKEISWCYSDAYYFEGTSRKILGVCSDKNILHSGIVLNALILNCFIPSATVVAKSEIFKRVGLFDEESGNSNEDWNMWLRVAAQYEVGMVRMPLAGIRVHNSSMTRRGNLDVELNNALFLVRRTVCHNHELLMPILGSAVARAKIRMAGKAIMRAERRFALKILCDLLATAPKNMGQVLPLIALALAPKSLVMLLGRVRRNAASRRYNGMSIDSVVAREGEILDAHSML